MIYCLLILFLYIWPFGQLLTFSIYPLDLIVFLLSVSLILSPKRREIFSGPILKPLIIFLCVATLSLLINFKQGTALSVFYLIRLIIYPSLFFAARHIGFGRLQKPLLISIGIFSLLCLLQYFAFPDMRYLKNLGFDDHFFRLIGSLYDPNFTGAILAALALLLISKNKLLHSFPFIGLLALTFSRASYLSFALGLIYLLITHKKIKLLLLLLLLAAIVFVLPKPSGEGVNLLRTFSIFSRLDSWQHGITLFLGKPIFGWGYNTLRSVGNTRFQIDNSFIYILATTGIFGFVALINLLRVLLRVTKDEGIRLMIISLLIHSLFNNSLFFIWILGLFWFSAGLGQNKPKAYKLA